MKKQTQKKMLIFPILLMGILFAGFFGGRALGFWAFVIDEPSGDPYDPLIIDPDLELEDPPYIPGDPDGDPPHIPGDPIPEIIIDEDGNVIVIIPDSENETETTEDNSTNINVIIIAGIIILVFGTFVVSMNKKKK